MSTSDSHAISMPRLSEAGLEEYGVVFSPSPGTYAVIRINAVEMVRHLADDEALAAAQAMQTKSYLICLKFEMDLPFPDKPWYRFRALPIGPHLPPADEAKGYTSAMCIPIFPNTRHPTGRAPVPSERPFPYGNCYYWLKATVDIRVRARPDDFDETHAVKIPSRAEVLMNLTWAEDLKRAKATVASRQPAAQDGAAAHALSRNTLPHAAESSIPSLARRVDADAGADVHSHTAKHNDACFPDSTEQPLGGIGSDAASVYSQWSGSEESTQGPADSVDDILHVDIFTGPDEDLALVPLVDLWPDIARNLKEEDIPSPLELYQEIETIQRIIQEARVRAYTAMMTAKVSDSKESASAATTSTPTMRWRFAPGLSAVGRKLSAPVKRLTSRLKSLSRPPYVVVWP